MNRLPLLFAAAAILVSAGPRQDSDPAELIKKASPELIKMEEGKDKGEWPYEGVYRVNRIIPIGYRVGGTAIVCDALLHAMSAKNKEGKAALERGIQFVLKGLDDDGRTADAIFLDADKSGYKVYLKEGLRILRKNALVMVDNAFAFGQLFDENPTDPEAPAVKEFNEIMAKTPEVQSIIIPIGDGCWVGVKN